MNKVVILGRGGAGKPSLAASPGTATGLPVVELEEHLWPADLTPISKGEWTVIQHRLTATDTDTVIVLDFPLWRCAWRTLRRSDENLDFRHWLIGYRKRSLPLVMVAIADHAKGARLHVPHSPREADQLLAAAAR